MNDSTKIIVHKGDLLLVDFKKNEGSEQNGIRPAIVIQNNIGNTFSPTTVVCPLTTKKKGMDATHVTLQPEECGLLKPSVILCEQIRVIDKSRICKKIGSIESQFVIKNIEKKIMVSFGILA